MYTYVKRKREWGVLIDHLLSPDFHDIQIAGLMNVLPSAKDEKNERPPQRGVSAFSFPEEFFLSVYSFVPNIQKRMPNDRIAENEPNDPTTTFLDRRYPLSTCG